MIDLQNIIINIPAHDETLLYLIKSGYMSLKNRVPVVSVVSDSTYGEACFVDDVIVFAKHKAVEVNKGKSAPKICTKIQKTFKIISQNDYNTYFRPTNITEISILEMQEEKTL